MPYFEQKNPTLAKISGRLGFAGTHTLAPILNGLHCQIDIPLRTSERFRALTVFNNDGFSKTISTTTANSTATVNDFVFGTDTDTNNDGAFNYIQWVTNLGTVTRSFYVKNLPVRKCLYINNQEAQGDEATIYVDAGSTDEYCQNCSLAFNILPYFSDEFFKQQFYTPNSYANTLRHWGGAETGEILIDGATKVAEDYLKNINSYYWEQPSYGTHPVVVRLRAALGSSNYVDINGTIRIRQIPCS
jgi:hypothetical protein